jgi:hypothetical protein
MSDRTRAPWLAWIYAATIFTSAFLLFQVQPLTSKHILPWFGGSPAVWTTCLLFFQTMLFAGYAYAHFTINWFDARRQALVHLALLAVATLVVVWTRILPGPAWEPTGRYEPVSRILLTLAVSVGLPYFVLAATGPLLQAWFARSFPGRIPYRLYALSNVGSLLALLSYPFFFEVMYTVPWQAAIWSIGFVAFAVLCSVTAWRSRIPDPSPSGRGQGERDLRVLMSAIESQATGFETAVPGVEPQTTGFAAGVPGAESSTPQTSNIQYPTSNIEHPASNPEPRGPSPQPPAPSSLTRILWLLLPAFASVVLMATTNHVSTDVAVVPFLWVIPLALYLITFIIAFDRPEWYRRTAIALLALAAIYGAALIYGQGLGWINFYDLGFTGRLLKLVAERLPGEADPDSPGPRIFVGFRTALALNFAAMFGICMFCHGELGRLRPHPKYLTGYFLMIAAGGALGGVAVSVIAPHVFDTYYEWELSMFVAAIGAIGMLLYALVGSAVGPVQPRGEPPALSTLVPRLLLIVLLVPTSLVLLDLVEYLHSSQTAVVFQQRNFFGTLTIRKKDDDAPHHVLLNGTTLHGAQYIDSERRTQPTTYYTSPSGIGRLFPLLRASQPATGLNIGAVGLGTGTMAAYAQTMDYICFYDINPAVIDMVNSGQWFTYVKDAKARRAICDIKLGDARLELERELKSPPRSGEGQAAVRYHVLVLDAFSSDAIPTHLLTAEAFEIYLKRLTTQELDGFDGALAVHVSNRYLDLERVVRAACERFGLESVEIHNTGNSSQLVNTATWIIVSRNKELIQALGPYAAEKNDDAKPPVLWTDAHSSLFEVLE